MPEQTLNRLAPGTRGIVQRVDGDGPIRRRLLEMGVTPGSRLHLVRCAPLGDPMEIVVRGYHLSLRRSEAQSVWVQPEG
jgi:Fe2+ transport system protein FeoA